MNINTEHFKMLGHNAQDVVTGLTGVVTCLSYDLYGCIQVLITPKEKDGEVKRSNWLDVTRVKILSDAPVMDLPDYSQGYVSEGRKGAAEKPVK